MKKPQKKQTIIYGGAFNPPTLAHEAILAACFNYASSIGADVWLLPSGDRRDKHIPTPRDQRLAYLRAMVSSVVGDAVAATIVLSEIDRTVPVETYDTVCELAASYPDREFIWVFGADSTETMSEWKKGGWMLRHLPMLVVQRAGSVINPRARRAVPLSITTIVTSSTEVRRRLAVGEPITGLVSDTVAKVLL